MSSSINQHVYRPPRDAEEVDEEEEMKKILNAGPKFQPHQGFKDTDEPVNIFIQRSIIEIQQCLSVRLRFK